MYPCVTVDPGGLGWGLGGILIKFLHAEQHESQEAVSLKREKEK